MLLDDAEEKRVQEEYSTLWTSLKLRFTAKYFSGPKLVGNGAFRGTPFFYIMITVDNC